MFSLVCKKLSQVLGTVLMLIICLSSTEKKPNYLKALSNIVNKLPKQVQVTELPAVSEKQTALSIGRLPLNQNMCKTHTAGSVNVQCFCPCAAPVSAPGGLVVSRPGRPAVHAVLSGARPRQPSAGAHPAAGGFGQQAAGPHLQSSHG